MKIRRFARFLKLLISSEHDIVVLVKFTDVFIQRKDKLYGTEEFS